MKKIQLGISGLGRIGKIHVQNIQRNSTSVGIKAAYHTNPNSKNWAQLQGVTHFYDDYKELIEDPAIDAIIIASPTSVHAEQIILAAKAGKAIFAEKPIDLNREKVNEVVRVLEETKVPFFLAFNRRFDPSVEDIKKTIVEGKIGTPEIIKVISRDPAPPPISYIPSSGGLFLDMAIHDFDMAFHLMNQEVVQVYSTGTVFGDSEIKKLDDIDTAMTTLTFANGAIAVIDNSRHAAYGYDQRIEVFCSKGLCGMDNQRINQSYTADSKGKHMAIPSYFFIERYEASYQKEMDLFLDCLLQNKPQSVGAVDGLRALNIALAAQKSVKENRVVSL
tara:strand:+ start:176 stop:1174 length:999 start_codon:yes stop_codon:yes gene_type:complete